MSQITPGWDDIETEVVNYKLKLYVTGASLNSLRAIGNIRNICEAHLKNQYSLEVIDVHQDHKVVEREQIVALPMLIRLEPTPVRRLIGDMSNIEKVLKGLGLEH